MSKNPQRTQERQPPKHLHRALFGKKIFGIFVELIKNKVTV